MMRRLLFIFGTFFIFWLNDTAQAQESQKELRIGVIVSLSGAASAYGTAVLEGIQTAVDELNDTTKITLVVEDDQSLPKNVSTIYQKLKTIDHIDALLAGSWWVDSIVKTVERDGIPFISCETLYNKDFVKGSNYFALGGDLRDWIKVYEPIIERKNWNTVLMVKFVSGFADTLRDELKSIFSKNGKKYLPEIEYSDLEMSEASTFATKAKASKADVLFVDSQPDSFASFVRYFSQLGNGKLAILTHSVADTAFNQGLFDPSAIAADIYFLRRSSYTTDFLNKFSKKFGKAPTLNADLGYYALLLAAQSLADKNPLAALKGGLTVAGIPFTFDENNVSHVIKQNVFTFQNGKPVEVNIQRTIK